MILKINSDKKRDLFSLIFCFLVMLFAAMPLFHGGLFPTIDNISVVRIEEMGKELKSGQFPVRMVSELAKTHGYMLYNFYAPLPFYVGAGIDLLGSNLVGALKRTFLLAFVIGTTSMFFFSKRFWGRKGAIVATVFFIFSPYLGFDLYQRGGLGEVWAYFLLPAVFWSFYEVAVSQKRGFVLLGAAAFGAILLSHNLTAFIMFPFLLFWTICFVKRDNLKHVVITFLLGVGLSAFFWLPAILEKSYIWVSYTQEGFSVLQKWLYRDIVQLISPYTFARFNFLYLFIPVAAILIFWRKKIPQQWVVSVSLLIFFASLLLTTGIAYWFWRIFFNFVYIVQFPWRFFTIATFFASFLAGAVIFSIPGKKSVLVSVLLMILAVSFSYKSFRPAQYDYIDKYRAEDPCGTTWGYEYLPVWVKTCLKQTSNSKAEISQGSALVLNTIYKPRFYQITVEGGENILRINEYYYPGWKAFVDGKEAGIFYNNQYGLMEISVPSGKHTITAVFGNTPLRTLANCISLVSFLMLVCISVFPCFRRRKSKIT